MRKRQIINWVQSSLEDYKTYIQASVIIMFILFTLQYALSTKQNIDENIKQPEADIEITANKSESIECDYTKIEEYIQYHTESSSSKPIQLKQASSKFEGIRKSDNTSTKNIIEDRQICKLYFDKTNSSIDAILSICIKNNTIQRQFISSEIKPVDSIGNTDKQIIEDKVTKLKSYESASDHKRVISALHNTSIKIACSAETMEHESMLYVYTDNGYNIILKLGADEKIVNALII